MKIFYKREASGVRSVCCAFPKNHLSYGEVECVGKNFGFSLFPSTQILKTKAQQGLRIPNASRWLEYKCLKPWQPLKILSIMRQPCNLNK